MVTTTALQGNGLVLVNVECARVSSTSCLLMRNEINTGKERSQGTSPEQVLRESATCFEFSTVTATHLQHRSESKIQRTARLKDFCLQRDRSNRRPMKHRCEEISLNLTAFFSRSISNDPNHPKCVIRVKSIVSLQSRYRNYRQSKRGLHRFRLKNVP